MSWEELVAAALIGTDRRPVEVSLPEGSPEGMAEALAERGPEDRLLGSAAAWTVARRAGAVGCVDFVPSERTKSTHPPGAAVDARAPAPPDTPTAPGDDRPAVPAGPASAGDDRPASAAAPTDDRAASAAAPTDDRPASAAAPTDDRPASAAAPTDDRPASAAAPTDDRPAAPAAPADDLAAAPAAPADDRAAAPAVPADDLAPPPAAAADDRPLAPSTRLRAMLEGDHPSLLPEWLALVAERGLRPPPELVPELLDHAAGDASLHAPVSAAAGPLGHWLAERAPRWAFVRGAAGDADEVWADGEQAERRALLERLRRSDPATARALLEGTFAEETWEDRAAFVATLAHGLSDADEPFLEAALDDKRKLVRTAAATLLAGLPSSRFAARMAARTAPLLHLEARRLRGRQLVADLPSEPDAAAERDGVPRSGRRSERLHALLAATPLSTWTGARPSPAAPSPAAPSSPAASSPSSPAASSPSSPAASSPSSPAASSPSSPAASSPATAPSSPAAASSPAAPPPPGAPPLVAVTAPATPSDLVNLSVLDDLGQIVHSGWAEAAIAQRDAEWARALWSVHSDSRLLIVLPKTEAEALAAAADAPDDAARALPAPWGHPLSKAVIDAIHARRSAGERGQDVEFAGHRLDPAFAQEAENRLRSLGGRDLHRLCDIVSARAAMLRELS